MRTNSLHHRKTECVQVQLPSRDCNCQTCSTGTFPVSIQTISISDYIFRITNYDLSSITCVYTHIRLHPALAVPNSRPLPVAMFG